MFRLLEHCVSIGPSVRRRSQSNLCFPENVRTELLSFFNQLFRHLTGNVDLQRWGDMRVDEATDDGEHLALDGRWFVVDVAEIL